MTSSTPCPEPAQLRKLLDGKLTPDEQAALSQHVDGCTHCQAALEQMSAGKESWNDIARHLGGEQEPAEPGLANAMNQLKAEADRSETTAEPATNLDGKLEFLDPPQKPGEIGRLGDYEIQEVVGKGGMGIVLKAFDSKLHRIVAIKVMSPMLAGHVTGRKRFLREAQAAAAVVHDHIVTIHAVDEVKGLPFIVMQYIAGRSLQQHIDDCGALELKEILRIGMQAASGLAAAHAQGLVHRDIKPANILLENGIERVKITDFGLARATDDARVTQSGIVTGTPQYMSPEQASGKSVDHRADLFSLGGVLYAMCTGYAPFRASSSMAVLKKVCDEAPRPIQQLNSEVPDWLVAIVDKLMAKDPKDRFQSAQEVASLLGQHLAHMQQPAVFPEPPGVMRPAPPAKKRGSRALVTVLVICAACLLLLPCLVGGVASLFWVGYSRQQSMSDELVSTQDEHHLTKTGRSGRTIVADRTSPFTFKMPGPSAFPHDVKQPLEPPMAPTVLKKFDPKTDKPITKEANGCKVTEEEGGWRIQHEFDPKASQSEHASIPLFQIAHPPIGGCRVTMKAQVKTDGKDSYAYLAVDTGEPFTVRGGSIRNGTTNWAPYEITWDQSAVINPPSLNVKLLIGGNGSIWIKDLEVVTTPLPGSVPAPSPVPASNPPSAKETLLKKFDPKTDQPFQTEIDDRHVSIEGDAWRIEAKKAPPSGPGFQVFARDIRLFELPKQNVERSKIVLRFKMRSEKVTVHSRVGISVGGQPDWRGGPEFDATVIGTTNWKDYALYVWSKDSGPKDIAVLVNIGGTGTIWLKEMELVRIPDQDTPAPSAPKKEPVKESILKKFDPKTDKPLTTSAFGRKVTEKDGGWQVEPLVIQEATDIQKVQRLELFELRRPSAAACRVTLRAQVKTEQSGQTTGFTEIAALELEAGPVGAVAKIGPVRRGVTNWQAYEVSIDWLRTTDPETLKINALIENGAKMLIKDLEIVTTPLPDAPAPAKKDATNETLLFRFTPDQKPITTEIGSVHIKPEMDGWHITNATTSAIPIPENDSPRIRLFELAKPDVAGQHVAIRCKIRSEKVTWAHLYLRDDRDWLRTGRKVEGTTNWTEYEFSFDCALNFHPERLGVDAGLSAGAIWIKDLEMVKSPSAEFLELQSLQGSWLAVEGADDGKPLTEEQLKHWKITVADRTFALEKAASIFKGEISYLDLERFPHGSSVSPTKMDGNQFLLYELEGDTWKVCGAPPGTNVGSFDAPAGSKRWLVTFKRVPDGKPKADEVVLKKFDPKTDKPVTNEVRMRKVTVDGDGWKIELSGLSELGSFESLPVVHLFEAPGVPTQPARITLRFKVKTEAVDMARFDLHLRYSAGITKDVVLKDRVIEGSTNWTTHEISWNASQLEKADAMNLDLLMRSKDSNTTTVLLKDVELVKTPLDK
jgi:tRNA A-37 threonylcarbamoyl transferase component Bud32